MREEDGRTPEKAVQLNGLNQSIGTAVLISREISPVVSISQQKQWQRTFFSLKKTG